MGASAKKAKFEFIFLNGGSWPVSEMCAALKATRQGYYAWRSRPPSAHAPSGPRERSGRRSENQLPTW